MTLFDLMPALFLLLIPAFLLAYAISTERLFLVCSGACFASLAASLASLMIFAQVICFFCYIAAVYAGLFIKRHTAADAGRLAVAVTEIDRGGGLILYNGRLLRTYPRDREYVYDAGDVLIVTKNENGVYTSHRI